MANQKVTDLTAKTTVLNTDTYHVVDTTDTSQDASGSSYKTTWATIKAAILALLSATSPITYSGGVFGFDPTANITFTHATLSSPTINTPTISTPAVSNPTISVGSDAAGDLYYRSSGGALARLGIGSVGQYLGVTAGLPAWGTPGIPSGTIAMFGGASAPANWLLCDGSAVSRTTYANLFTAISTTYGPGDGSTTFNVPDMRGRVPVGVGTGTGGGASGTGLPTGGSALTAVARGTWKGEETHLLTIPEMPSHTHNLGNTTGGGSNIVSSAGGNTNTIGTDATGGGGTHNNIQPIMGVNFIIAI
jgi:microcystin-dependent protein